MLKFIGFMLLILAGGGIGLSKSAAMKHRARALEQMCELIRFMMWQLKYTALPLPELAVKVEKRAEFSSLKLGGKFSENTRKISFEKAWNEAISLSEKANCFTREDVEVIRKFGAGLGKTDISAQNAHAEICVLLLEKQQQKAAALADEKGKVTLALWFSASTVVALLLL